MATRKSGAEILSRAKRQAQDLGRALLVKIDGVEMAVFPDGLTCPAPACMLPPGALPSEPYVTEGGVEALIEAARAHGAESEADHEVGDLQEVLRSCWSAMTPAQKATVFESHRELLEWRTENEARALPFACPSHNHPRPCRPGCPGWVVRRAGAATEVHPCADCGRFATTDEAGEHLAECDPCAAHLESLLAKGGR